MQSAKRRGEAFAITKGVKAPVPESATTSGKDALPVSTSGADKAASDAAEGTEQAKAAGQEGIEKAKKGLNQGLDKVQLPEAP